MDISGGIQASLAGRYASALFSLARDEKQLAEVETSVATLRAALNESEDFAALTKSQTISRAAAEKIVASLAETIKLDKMTGNLLGVLATNRRLGQLSSILAAFDQLVAAQFVQLPGLSRFREARDHGNWARHSRPPCAQRFALWRGVPAAARRAAQLHGRLRRARV